MALADRPQTLRAPSDTQNHIPDRPPATLISSEDEQRVKAGAPPAYLHVNPCGAVGEDASTFEHGEELSGARLLLRDIRIAFLLANEARYRTTERAFGVPRDQANLVTFAALLLLLEAAHDKTEELLRGPGPPTRADAVLGAAALREVLYGVGGSSARDTPLFAALMMLALLGGLSGPALRRSVRGIEVASHRMRHSFNHRYGHLLGPGRDRTDPPR